MTTTSYRELAMAGLQVQSFHFQAWWGIPPGDDRTVPAFPQHQSLRHLHILRETGVASLGSINH